MSLWINYNTYGVLRSAGRHGGCDFTNGSYRSVPCSHKEKVDALTHSIDCGLSPLDGLHKNVESTMPTDAPLAIVAIDMEDSIMSKVLSQLESCEDAQDEAVCDSQIFDSYPTRPLMDEDKGLQIGVTTDLENQEEAYCSVFVDVYGAGDANEVHKSKANVSLHHHVFSSFPSAFCKEEANTISELTFDPGGNYYMAHLLSCILDMSSTYLRQCLMICTHKLRTDMISSLFNMDELTDQVAVFGLLLVSHAHNLFDEWHRSHRKLVKEFIRIVALILPWNYILLLSMWTVVTTLSVGCTTIIHPSQFPTTVFENIDLGRDDLGVGMRLHKRVMKCDLGTVAWMAMLTDHPQSGFYQEALSLFINMKIFHSRPNHFSLLVILKACASMGHFHFGTRIHALFVASGYVYSLPGCNSPIDKYGKCLSSSNARIVFDEMSSGQERTLTWCSLPFANINPSLFSMASELCHRMLVRIAIAWNIMIVEYAQWRKVEEFFQVFWNAIIDAFMEMVNTQEFFHASQQFLERKVVSMVAWYTRNGSKGIFENFIDLRTASWIFIMLLQHAFLGYDLETLVLLCKKLLIWNYDGSIIFIYDPGGVFSLLQEEVPSMVLLLISSMVPTLPKLLLSCSNCTEISCYNMDINKYAIMVFDSGIHNSSCIMMNHDVHFHDHAMKNSMILSVGDKRMSPSLVQRVANANIKKIEMLYADVWEERKVKEVIHQLCEIRMVVLAAPSSLYLAILHNLEVHKLINQMLKNVSLNFSSSINLEDKVPLKGGGNVMILDYKAGPSEMAQT
ncbi:pentatricopeptide repeat-containing protein [Senna tora]|uniref:Pentatricopeptide repeat-containing protein n=1 Tax=Senna tora TaxID=362788 RepID=A0A834WUN1_9FABA|nr:pentatricopeptide repeat-containing protein [Senna tora]